MLLTKKAFIYNSKLNVWSPNVDIDNFYYTDGSEDALYKKLLAYKDKSIYSEELSHYNDWSEEYHLSPLRSNILRAVQNYIKPGRKVLELGCGCGAITRYLGEQECEVVAIEGSIDRARVAGVRCSDLPNVDIYCANFQDIDFRNESFDIITLIGVFEYSALYWKGETPYESCLRFLDNHCDKSTVLMIAIENQLGLKYFNGMLEDHEGKKFYGINNLYQAEHKTAQTFTKSTLSRLIKSNLKPKHLEFLSPFPDYKLATIILSEDAFTNKELKFYQIISMAKSRDYGTTHTPLFHEPSVFELLQDEGVAASFVNSFLIIASKETQQKQDWLVKIISNTRRIDFCTKTIIRNNNGSLVVEKHRLKESKIDDPLISFEIESYSKFLFGELLSFKLERIFFFSKNSCWKNLKNGIIHWAKYLKINCKGSGLLMAGDWYDAIPNNIIASGNTLNYFDKEWMLKNDIEIQFIIIRGILSIFSHLDRAIWVPKIPHKNLKSLICEIFKELDLSYDDDFFEKAWSLDAKIHSLVYTGLSEVHYYNIIKRLTTDNLSLQRFFFSLSYRLGKLVPWTLRTIKRVRALSFF